MKKYVLALLLVFQLCIPSGVFAAEKAPEVYGKYGVAIDAKTGSILYDKKAKEAAAPASMTKVLTALIIAEEMDENEKIKVTPESIGTECSCYGVEKGEVLSKKDALEALMIKSANDVAVAAAQHISGSVEEFAKLMNKRAKEIGVSNQTNFVTPNGLTPDENAKEKHHVTAYDMALIVREAVKNPEVLSAMSSKEYTVKTNKKEVTLTRHDRIFKHEHAKGGKTGFTSAAGNTLTVYYKKDNKEVISVVMKSSLSAEYTDVDNMADYAFSKIKEKKVVDKGAIVSNIEFGKEKVNFITDDEFYLTYKKDEDVKISKKVIKYDLDNKSRIEKGQEIGKMEILKNGKKIEEIPLIADQTIQKEIKKEMKVTKEGNRTLTLPKILLAIILPLALYAGFVVYYNMNQRGQVGRRKEK